VFLALLLAAIEGGIVFYERLSVHSMSLAGARSASGQGSDVLADYQVLRSAQAAQGGMAGGQINMVVVYKASAWSDHVPAGCKTASVAGSCNRYVSADLTKDATQFGCTGSPAKIDNPWCPSGRRTALSGTYGPPDYVGVYVEAQHRDLTGFLGPNILLHSDTVFRLEPRTLS